QGPGAAAVAGTADQLGDRLVVEVDRGVDGARVSGGDVRVVVGVEVVVRDPRARVVREVARAGRDLATDAARDRRDRDVRDGDPDDVARRDTPHLLGQRRQPGP